MGCSLQRLFSTFPDGWPGVGLLLLRLGAGISLLYLSVATLPGDLLDPIRVIQKFIAAAGGILLLAGLWTPVVGAAITIDELWVAFSRQPSLHGDQWIHILLAVLSAGVAMLGPGAWSVDAHLFGRKRFDLGPRNGQQ